MAAEPRRVDDDDLDWDEDLRLLDGVPFTGIGVSHYHDGKIAGEWPYRDGFEEGICREWYSNGILMKEWLAVRGCATGEVKEWYDDGAIKSIEVSEQCVRVRKDDWDRSGRLVTTWQIDEHSSLWNYLLNQRAAHGQGPGPTS